jgi:hypothetical protein
MALHVKLAAIEARCAGAAVPIPGAADLLNLLKLQGAELVRCWFFSVLFLL